MNTVFQGTYRLGFPRDTGIGDKHLQCKGKLHQQPCSNPPLYKMENEYLSHWEQAIVTKTFLGHRYAMNIFRVGVNYQQPVTLFIQNDTIL